MATVLVYLNDVPEGGGTRLTRGNVTVLPRTGRAFVFFGAGEDGFCDPLSEHEALAVAQGTKIVLQKWYLSRAPPGGKEAGAEDAAWQHVRRFMRSHAEAVAAALTGSRPESPREEGEEGDSKLGVEAGQARQGGADEQAARVREAAAEGRLPFTLCDHSGSCREYLAVDNRRRVDRGV